ncbi:MAG: hypothetical protein ABUT20_39260 [Bacteroidota bacterium]
MSTTLNRKKLQRVYTTKLQDIQRGINPEKNLHDIEDILSELDDIIQKERQRGLVTPALAEVRNDFLGLKNLISEQH